MADRSTQLILSALSRAVTHPEGVWLHGLKGSPGLFPSTLAGKQAARRAREEGLLKVLRSETRGQREQELCAATDKGLSWLLLQSHPRLVLEDLVRALEARQKQAGELASTARQMLDGLESLRAAVEKVLERVGRPGGPDWREGVLSYLDARGSAEDCPLPELYRQARRADPGLSLGAFHDGLREFHAAGRLYLHPWTGPLYEIPEPACALLVGHEVAYYASPRRSAA